MNIGKKIESLSDVDLLDDLDAPLHEAANVVAESSVADVLRGEALGHPAHPAFVQLPIGCWTTSMVLDLMSPLSRGARFSADLMVGLGVLSAPLAVGSGLLDYDSLEPSRRRVAAAHAAVNGVATALYATSLLARLRGKRRRGVLWGACGATVATVGATIGGHLAFWPSEPNATTDATESLRHDAALAAVPSGPDGSTVSPRSPRVDHPV